MGVLKRKRLFYFILILLSSTLVLWIVYQQRTVDLCCNGTGPGFVEPLLTRGISSFARGNMSLDISTFNLSLPKKNVKNWTLGSDYLVFLHIQRTAGKTFLYYVGSVTQNGIPLCPNWPSSNSTHTPFSKQLGRLMCPIANASYYPNQALLNTLRNKPMSSKEHRKWRTLRRMKRLPEMWLQAEVTYQWPCGIHAFLTATKPCVLKFYNKRYGVRDRRFHYFTILRHPILRYLSEYLYTSYGKAKWNVVTGVGSCDHTLILGNTKPQCFTGYCNGTMISESTLPECYPGIYDRVSWTDVSLTDFMNCPYNWANNRQTWMLADLEQTACSNDSITKEQMETNILKSAKKNLESFAFFGFTEYLKESAMLFEYKFNVQFKDLPQQQHLQDSRSLLKMILLDKNLYNRIIELNKLDIQLYEYALKLFTLKLNEFGLKIDLGKIDSLFNELI